MELYPIPPGLWCVPSALSALTGADPEIVIHPALNRHSQAKALTEIVTGSAIDAAEKALKEFGYNVRRYRSNTAGALRARVSTWARRSHRWPGRALLVFTTEHALVIQDGRVYDSWAPHGPNGDAHPYATAIVVWAALIEKRS